MDLKSSGVVRVVTLSVDGPGGTDTNTKASYITVYTPAARFKVSSKSGQAPLTITFSDRSVGSVDSWKWDFDGDSIVDSTVQNPSFQYNVAGNYTVTLTVTGPGGSDVKTKENVITVLP